MEELGACLIIGDHPGLRTLSVPDRLSICNINAGPECELGWPIALVYSN